MTRLNCDKNSDHRACRRESTFEVERRGGAFKVVASVPECLEDGKEFLIVGVIVQLQSGQSPGVVRDQTNLSVSAGDRQDASDSVVGGVSFHNDRGVRNEVSEDGRSSEGMLERVEGMSTVLGEVPRSVFLGEPGKRDHDVRVVENEPAVEIGEA